ncbi:MAG: sugar ABC transporter permease [Acidimicrobiia bacterium]
MATDTTVHAGTRTPAATSAKARGRSPHAEPDGAVAAALIAPALVGLLVFTYVPALLSFVASVFDVPLSDSAWTFTGLDNYRAVLGDAKVRQAAWNTLLYAAFTIVPSLLLGLGLALLASGAARARGLLSALLFLPLTANLVAMAVVFRWMFAFRGGFANQMLGLVGVGPLNFLGDGATALPTVAAVGVWRSASFAMVLFLAGLTAIPTAIHEAAASDGLWGWSKLRLITVPMLQPTIVLATVVAALQAIQVFDTIEVMTGGGPLGQTETLLTVTWRIGFEAFQLGRASALSFMLLVVLLAVGWLRRTTLLRSQR